LFLPGERVLLHPSIVPALLIYDLSMKGCRTWASTALKVLRFGFVAQYCPMAGGVDHQGTLDHSPKMYITFNYNK
jgi:hypothetical protein